MIKHADLFDKYIKGEILIISNLGTNCIVNNLVYRSIIFTLFHPSKFEVFFSPLNTCQHFSSSRHIAKFYLHVSSSNPMLEWTSRGKGTQNLTHNITRQRMWWNSNEQNKFRNKNLHKFAGVKVEYVFVDYRLSRGWERRKKGIVGY